MKRTFAAIIGLLICASLTADAAKLYPAPIFRWETDAGAPASGWKVYTYEAGTTTPKATYTDASGVTPNSNPVILDARGEAAIWFAGTYKLVVKDGSDVTQATYDDFGAGDSATAPVVNLVGNGSFETDANADSLPDDWTTVKYDAGTSTATLITSSQAHGANALKFGSLGDGGGTATQNGYSQVNPGRIYWASFAMLSSVVDVRNVVDVLYYDSDQVYISTQTLYDESAANPLTMTVKTFVMTIPATARYVRIKLTGCHSSDATPGYTLFDDVLIESIAQDTGTTATTYTINAAGNKGILDPSGNTGNRTYTLPDATGTVALTTDAPLLTYGLSGYANILMNGDFLIWDYGTTVTSPATNKYVVNRWVWMNTSAAAISAIQSADVPTEAESSWQSKYSLKLDTTTADASVAAGDYAYISQRVEGQVFLPLLKRTGYLTFWVKSPKTGAHCVAFQNSGQDRSYVKEYTVDAANTWEKKTISLSFSETGGTWDYTNGVGLRVVWALIGGSTYQTTADAWQTGNYINTAACAANNILDNTANDFLLSQADLRSSNSAPMSFVGRPTGVEKDLCARYYEVLGKTVDTNGGYIIISTSYTSTLTYYGATIFYVEKRAVPTATKTGTWSVATSGQPAVANVTRTSLYLNALTNAAPAASASAQTTALGEGITIDAEL
ncbi:MAG: hypothetical protein OEV92_03960 [Nitrospinota bacterium]|nr:hypothetical protein [Nitrospinota bacterium]